MGFDVYGQNPKNDKGKYFRANIWWWPPLWDYCEEVAPEIAKNVEYPLSNDGSGLDAQDAEALANALDMSLLTDTAIKKEAAYHARLDSFPMKECPMKSEEKDGAKHSPSCLFCDGEGEVHDVPMEASFTMKPFAVDLVKEFMTFCRNSGGFEIH